MLSLREATDSGRNNSPIEGLSTNGKDLQSIKFFNSRVGISSGEGDIPPEAYLELQVEIWQRWVISNFIHQTV